MAWRRKERESNAKRQQPAEASAALRTILPAGATADPGDSESAEHVRIVTTAHEKIMGQIRPWPAQIAFS